MIKIHADRERNVLGVETAGTPEQVAFELVTAINAQISEYAKIDGDAAPRFYGTLLQLLCDDDAFTQMAKNHMDTSGSLS